MRGCLELINISDSCRCTYDTARIGVRIGRDPLRLTPGPSLTSINRFTHHTPPFVIGLAIILLFGLSGTVTQFVAEIFNLQPTRWVYGLPGILIAQLLSFTPIAFLVLIGVVEGVAPSMDCLLYTSPSPRDRG